LPAPSYLVIGLGLADISGPNKPGLGSRSPLDMPAALD
jgi:hypothetical protein